MQFIFENPNLSDYKITDRKVFTNSSFFVVEGPRGGQFALMSYLENPDIFWVGKLVSFNESKIKGVSKFKLIDNKLVDFR